MASMTEAMAELRAQVADAAKALTLGVAAELTEACPVKTGHARRNFVPSISAPGTGEDDGAAQTAGTESVLSYRIGDGDLYVVNNVPYIGQLILGSSIQAPAGWDLVAIDAAVADVNRQFGVSIDVSSAGQAADRGAQAAENLVAAVAGGSGFGPTGDE